MTIVDRRPPGAAPSAASARAAASARSAASARPAAPVRDAGIDAARAACLVVVFALHAMMVGVSVGPDGPVLENALTGWSGFAAATWIVQVMPLFFVIGGFAARTSWSAHVAHGGTATVFVRRRIERLARPALVLVGVVGAALAALALAGVPAEIVAIAGQRIGQPLWFLAVYLGCSALVPAMSRWHDRAPIGALVVLAGAVVAVDVVRGTSGIDAVGYANLAFVWLLMQQLGFHLADGRLDRMPRARRVLIAVGAVATLAAAAAAGAYSPDLLENLNPPTGALVLLGVAQLMLFSLGRDRLRRWAERPRAARLVDRFGAWGMTLHLWHLPAFIALAGGLLVAHELVGLALPVPLTGPWWASRPVWLLAAALVTAVPVAAFARFERAGRGIRVLRGARLVRGIRPTSLPVWGGVVAAILGVGVALVVGFAPPAALASVALLAVALAGSAPGRRPSTGRRPPAARASVDQEPGDLQRERARVPAVGGCVEVPSFGVREVRDQRVGGVAHEVERG